MGLLCIQQTVWTVSPPTPRPPPPLRSGFVCVCVYLFIFQYLMMFVSKETEQTNQKAFGLFTQLLLLYSHHRTRVFSTGVYIPITSPLHCHTAPPASPTSVFQRDCVVGHALYLWMHHITSHCTLPWQGSRRREDKGIHAEITKSWLALSSLSVY